MHNLFDFLKKYYYIFLFLLLETGSMALFFRFNDYQGSVWFTSAATAAAEVDRLHKDWMSYLDLAAVNGDLTRRNVMLQRQLCAMREELASYEKDSTLLEKKMQERLKGYQVIHAQVTSNTLHRKDNYIVIDKGAADGVCAEMGVVGGGGVVGIVQLTGPHYSLVQSVLNTRSSISCRLRGQRFFGYLVWSGGSSVLAYLTDVPRYAKLKKGNYVETSGYSSIFPPGIFVGKVIEISDSSDGLSYRMKVNLGTDFARLRDVCVIKNIGRAEVDSLRVNAVEAAEE